MTPRATTEAAVFRPQCLLFFSLCLCFGFSFFGWFGSFLVDAMRIASWGSVSFVSVCVKCQETHGRFYDAARRPEYDATVI